MAKKLNLNPETEDNLVKKTCRELGITQKELAEKLNISLPTVNRWSYSNQIPEQSLTLLSLFLENYFLKNQINEMKNAFSTLTKYSLS